MNRDVMEDDVKIFSVIISVHNESETLKLCLEALAKQYFPAESFEIIVCNGSVNDDSGNVLSDLGVPEDRYRLITKTGIANARNEAIRQAQGKYLLFLDDDAIADPSLLIEHEKVHLRMEDKKIAVLGRFDYITEAQKQPFVYFLHKKPIIFAYPSMQAHSYYNFRFFWSCNISINREAVAEVGGFDAIFNETFIGDIELGYRLEKKGYTVYYQPEARTQKHHSLDIQGFISRQQNYGQNLIQLFQKHSELLKKERALLGFADFSKKTIDIMKAYLNSTSNIEQLISILERINKLEIENPEFIPMNNGRYINSAELIEMLDKYVNIINLHFLYKGTLNGLELHGTPKATKWKITERNRFKSKKRKPRLLITSFGWKNVVASAIMPHDIAVSLAEKGWQVAVLYVGIGTDPTALSYHVSKEESEGVTIYGMYNRKTPPTMEDYPEYEITDKIAATRFTEVLDEFRPEVIHYHNILGFSFEIAKIAYERNIPAVYTPHNYYVIDPKLYMMRSFTEHWGNLDLLANTPLADKHPERIDLYHQRKKVALEFINKYCEHTLAISDRVGELLIEYGGDVNKISTMHQIPKSSEKIVRNEAPLGKIRFAYIGLVVPHNGVHKILQAAEYLAEDSTEIFVYGDAYPQYLRKLEKMDVNKLMRWKPPYKSCDIQKVFDSFDVLIVPSIWEEGASLMIIEALQAGKPILAADIGGIPDFVKHGENGLLYPSNHDKRLAELMLNLIKKPYLVEAMRENCKISYSFDDMLNHLDTIYMNMALGKKIDKQLVEKKI